MKKNPPRKGWREWKLTEGLCKGFMTAYASAAYRRGYLDDLVFDQVRCFDTSALPAVVVPSLSTQNPCIPMFLQLLALQTKHTA
jgi:hypothetical protein